MKNLSYHRIICLLAGIFLTSAGHAQITVIHGSTYEERSHSLVDQMSMVISNMYLLSILPGYGVTTKRKLP